MRRAVAMLLFALCVTAPEAAADTDFVAPDPSDFDFSWNDPDESRLDAYEKAMATGDSYALRAARWLDPTGMGMIAERQSLAARAVEAYEKAAKADPSKAEPHYRAAEVINAHFLSRDQDFAQAHARLAIHHWTEFQRLAPRDPRVMTILFRRSLIYTKLATEEDFAHAVADLELLLKLNDLSAVPARDASVWLGNLAEMYMMQDRLDEAITTYERALDLSKSVSHALGLAVALDRHGQKAMAREVAHLYMSEGSFNQFYYQLRRGEIFFVPDGEEHYYLAMAHEALGLLSQARAHYLDFIMSGAHPEFDERARENVAALEKQIQKLKSERGKSRAKRAPRR